MLLGLVGVTGPVGFASDRAADLVGSTLLGFGLLTAFVTAYFALRPAEPAALLDPSDEQRLRGLLDRHGRRDSLGYFALRRDKSVVFSPSGKAAVTYRVVHGVLLASGDPVGDPEAWPGAIEATLRLARRYAWTPAVIGCGERGATVWTRSGLGAYELGDEAVLDLPAFSLDGRPMRGIRQAVARVAAGRGDRDGPADPRRPAGRAGRAGRGRGRLARRRASSAASRWRCPGSATRPTPTACWSPPGGRTGRCAGCCTSSRGDRTGCRSTSCAGTGTPTTGSTSSWSSRWPAAGAELGVTPALAELRGACGRRWRTASGSAPARCARLWRSMLLLASRWWQIETLHRFNAKFQPGWEPRYLCFASGRQLPRVALAALEAEAFLVRPRPLRMAPACAPPLDLCQSSIPSRMLRRG